jgi:metallo-beta-lactamase family protein
MDLTFLGAAATVTGSHYFLETDRSRLLIDCGLFQGMPNESIRNRIPPPYDPAAIDAVVVTHAHLDHCGMLPLLVKAGYRGPIYATMGTIELAGLVLLDSGRLHEEFAKREARWERRHPDAAEADDAREERAYEAAIELAHEGDELNGTTVQLVAPPPGSVRTGEHVPTTIEPHQPTGGTPRDPEADVRATLPPETAVDLDAPLYTEDDAAAVLPQFRPVRYGHEVEVAPGIVARFDDAGHILGSSIIRLRVREGAGQERTIVFSGDLGRRDAPILRDPTREADADYVVCESTYGGREHDPQAEAVRVLAETVRLVDEAGGVLLVPSFAIGRTQEVVWQLDRLLEEGRIPKLPLYLDSPMASKASEIYHRHVEYYDDQTRKLFESGASPLDFPGQHVTKDFRDSQAIEHAPRPYMIVASNGMLTGGRIVGHLRHLIDDPAATILFVGYQGDGTLGAHLQAGAKTVKLDGAVRQVRCKVRSISGFSSHADESQLLDWLRGFAPDPAGTAGSGPTRRVFLVHGDPEAQTALAPKVEALGLTVHVPQWRERVTL